MKKIIIGVIREGKVPPDKRVPLTPEQCVKLQTIYPHVQVIVQPSPIRAFLDHEYLDLGIELNEDLSGCDILIGVKEVNIEDLIPNKKYLFFSHTFKKQPYNRELLRAVLEKQVQLIDYEVLKDKSNKRIIGFGRYAGIVGCYNGFLTYGLKHNLYSLKAANKCANRKEVEEELKKVILPKNTKIILTGFGRVGHGAREILGLLPVKEVSPDEFLSGDFDEPVFAHLELEDYYAAKDGSPFEKSTFYKEPDMFKSTFNRYLSKMDMYIPCHYWSEKADFIFTREDLKAEDLRLSVVADISCDIDGPVACTIRPSKIADPIYGYDPISEKETEFKAENSIAVMAVDNLPCELPLDASDHFGSELIREVFPALIKNDTDAVIERGSQTTLAGELSSYFSYLDAYVAGTE